MEVSKVFWRTISCSRISRLDCESFWTLDVLVVVISKSFTYHINYNFMQFAVYDVFLALYAVLQVYLHYKLSAISDRYKDLRSAQFD
jgi:hypothetical protein